MKCPACSHESSRVLESRLTEAGQTTRRRRECEACEFRFTTFERIQSSELMVSKRNGQHEPYNREKLEKAILIACGKRRIPPKIIREKLSELEEKWGKKGIVGSSTIGEDVVAMLKGIDDVAFIRFASVYKEFQDVDSFRDFIAGEG